MDKQKELKNTLERMITTDIEKCIKEESYFLDHTKFCIDVVIKSPKTQVQNAPFTMAMLHIASTNMYCDYKIFTLPRDISARPYREGGNINLNEVYNTKTGESLGLCHCVSEHQDAILLFDSTKKKDCWTKDEAYNKHKQIFFNIMKIHLGNV